MHLGVFLALPLYLSILSGAWLKRPAVIFLPLFSFLALIGKLFWRERHGAAQQRKLKRCLPRNASDIRASTKFDFWADKSRFPPPQIQISEATNPGVWGRNLGWCWCRGQLAHLFKAKMIHGRWHGRPFQKILTRLIHVCHFPFIGLRQTPMLSNPGKGLWTFPST